MRCTHCSSIIGKIKTTYFCFCKTSKNKIGMMLADEKNEIVAWINDTRMYCKCCRPSATYTHRNWALPKEKQ